MDALACFDPPAGGGIPPLSRASDGGKDDAARAEVAAFVREQERMALRMSRQARVLERLLAKREEDG